MISIGKALQQIIGESPFLEDALYHEYLNLSAFASYIQSRVKQITKKDVTLGSIKMALSRYKCTQHKNIKFKRFQIEDFFIKKNIHIIYMKKNSDNIARVQKLYQKQNNNTQYMAHISGEREIALIYDEKISENIDLYIPLDNRKLQLNKLALVGIFLEEENINEIGIIYTLTKKLNFNNINMIEIISNYTEVSFIIQEEDLSHALEVLL